MHYFGETVDEQIMGEFRVLEKQHSGGEVIPRHVHQRPYITAVLSGAYEERQDGTKVLATRATALFHPSGADHEDEFFNSSRLLVVELPGSCLDLPGFRDPWVSSSAEVGRFTVIARRELRDPDEFSATVLHGISFELAAAISRSNVSDRRGRTATEVRSIIEERFAEPLGLQSIARELGCDPSVLAREFRATTGQTVGESIRARRVDYVCERLRGERSLAEIALDAGFADQSHMTRTFRRQTGMTPGTWRRLHFGVVRS